MESMSPIGVPAARWYRSFYFRIGASFVVFMVAVVVAQSAIVGVMVRAGGGLGPRPLGAGDLTARAPEQGGDEIAHVAGAFRIYD